MCHIQTDFEVLLISYQFGEPGGGISLSKYRPGLQNLLVRHYLKLLEIIWLYPRCEFRSAARVVPSGHGWPFSGDQGLVTIVGHTVVYSVWPSLATNIGNQRCARPLAQLWPGLQPTVGPSLANYFRWPWYFGRPTSRPWLNQSLAYY